MKISAGLLMYRWNGESPEVLLVHPGGPLWQRKDLGAWTAPKGEVAQGEEALNAAIREFTEETGLRPRGPFLELAPVRQKGGKTVRIWAFEDNCDPGAIRSNSFKLEWPPHSGEIREFPEIDCAAFFGIEEARDRINPAQVSVLEELLQKIGRPSP